METGSQRSGGGMIGGVYFERQTQSRCKAHLASHRLPNRHGLLPRSCRHSYTQPRGRNTATME
jgi:hypothetical protein